MMGTMINAREGGTRMQQVARRITTLCPMAVVLLPLLLAGPAFFSRAAEPGVTDSAKFFSADVVEKADAEIKRIKSETGKDLVIETFLAIPEERQSAWDAAKNDNAKKREFFAQWLAD